MYLAALGMNIEEAMCLSTYISALHPQSLTPDPGIDEIKQPLVLTATIIYPGP